MRTLIESHKKLLKHCFNILLIMFLFSFIANFFGVYKHNEFNRKYTGTKYITELK